MNTKPIKPNELKPEKLSEELIAFMNYYIQENYNHYWRLVDFSLQDLFNATEKYAIEVGDKSLEIKTRIKLKKEWRFIGFAFCNDWNMEYFKAEIDNPNSNDFYRLSVSED